MQNRLKREQTSKGQSNHKAITRVQIRHEDQSWGREQRCEGDTVGGKHHADSLEDQIEKGMVSHTEKPR